MRETETQQTGKSGCGVKGLHNTNPFKKWRGWGGVEFLTLSHLLINSSLVIAAC